jgi:integrase
VERALDAASAAGRIEREGAANAPCREGPSIIAVLMVPEDAPVAGGPSEAEPGDGCAAAARSAAALVKPPAHTPRERETWSKAEVRKFLAKASPDRLYVAWRLSLYGLHRGEVLGLRWSDIDLRATTLTVNQAWVLVEYRIGIEEPRSQRQADTAARR